MCQSGPRSRQTDTPPPPPAAPPHISRRPGWVAPPRVWLCMVGVPGLRFISMSVCLPCAHACCPVLYPIYTHPQAHMHTRMMHALEECTYATQRELACMADTPTCQVIPSFFFFASCRWSRPPACGRESPLRSPPLPTPLLAFRIPAIIIPDERLLAPPRCRNRPRFVLS